MKPVRKLHFRNWPIVYFHYTPNVDAFFVFHENVGHEWKFVRCFRLKKNNNAVEKLAALVAGDQIVCKKKILKRKPDSSLGALKNMLHCMVKTVVLLQMTLQRKMFLIFLAVITKFFTRKENRIYWKRLTILWNRESKNESISRRVHRGRGTQNFSEVIK